MAPDFAGFMIAAAVAGKAMAPRLAVRVTAALGLTRERIVEACSGTAVYAGFPAAVNGLLGAFGDFWGLLGVSGGF